MNKEELIEKFNSIVDINKDYNTIYELLEELGIKFNKTSCSKCRRDFYNIIKEELFDDYIASENSDWDDDKYSLIYTYPRPVNWKGTIVNKNSPKSVLQAFYNEHPKFFMRQLKLDI